MTDSLAHVAVCILNWNGRRHLETYLPSVVEHSADAQIVVIDNGSTDDSHAWVSSHFPHIHWIQLIENLGFAGGYNAGLAQIQAQYFVLLNSDVRVTAHWIPPVLRMMESDGFAACQPKIRNDLDVELFEYAGAAGGFLDRDGFAFCAGRMFEVFESDAGQYDVNREVFWASGAALFIRSDAYRAVGGLDPDFFAHMEEIDLCWRLKNRGHRVGYCSESVVFHLGGGTLQKVNPFKTYLNFRNNLFLLLKNDHRLGWWLILIRRMILDGVAALRFLTEGNRGLFLAVFHAHVSFYGALRSTWKKRNAESRDILSGAFGGPCEPLNPAGWYRRSVVWDYFVRRRLTFDELASEAFLISVNRKQR